jgi:hypothetical protein
MKRILIVCILFAAICTPKFVQQAVAQSATPIHVSATDFSAKVNLLDSYIAAGDMTSAKTTWLAVHRMMLDILGYTKNSIRIAATPADKATYETIMGNQRSIYNNVWQLKTDLAANRSALHTKLGEFDATIY